MGIGTHGPAARAGPGSSSSPGKGCRVWGRNGTWPPFPNQGRRLPRDPEGVLPLTSKRSARAHGAQPACPPAQPWAEHLSRRPAASPEFPLAPQRLHSGELSIIPPHRPCSPCWGSLSPLPVLVFPGGEPIIPPLSCSPCGGSLSPPDPVLDCSRNTHHSPGFASEGCPFQQHLCPKGPSLVPQDVPGVRGKTALQPLPQAAHLKEATSPRAGLWSHIPHHPLPSPSWAST